jgi:hypothetical protein
MKPLAIALTPALLLTAAYAQEDPKPAGETRSQSQIDTNVDQASAASSKACFNFDEVKAFKTVDADTIRVETHSSKTFDLDLSGPKCGALDKAGDLSIKSAPIFMLCEGRQNRGRLVFQSPESAEPMSCSMSKVTPTQQSKPK